MASDHNQRDSAGSGTSDAHARSGVLSEQVMLSDQAMLSDQLATGLGEWDAQRTASGAGSTPSAFDPTRAEASASTPDWDRIESRMWDVIDGEARDAAVSEHTLATATMSPELRALSTEYNAHAAACADRLEAHAAVREAALFSALFNEDSETANAVTAARAGSPAGSPAAEPVAKLAAKLAAVPAFAPVKAASNVVALAARHAISPHRPSHAGWRTPIAIGFAAAAAAGFMYTTRVKDHAITPNLGEIALQSVRNAGGTQAKPAAQNAGLAARSAIAASTLTFVETNAALVRKNDGASDSPMATHSELHEHESFVLSSAHAAFEQRNAAGELKVAWAADALGGTNHTVLPVNATVLHASSPLVLALESGAIEAEVAPVAVGEAFAIDVGASRVAVHGTHLRVSRAGSRISVDLIHGEIAIGRIPTHFARTAGRTILAPAHVEFDAESPEALTLGGASVREILTFGASAGSNTVGGWATGAWTAGIFGNARADGSRAGLDKLAVLSAQSGGTQDSAKNPNRSAQNPGSAAPATNDKAAVAGITSRGQLVNAVRLCIERQAIHASDAVKVTVGSNLELHLREDGTVQGARFSPPLQPAAQECAAAAIYGSKLEGEPRQLQLDIQVQK